MSLSFNTASPRSRVVMLWILLTTCPASAQLPSPDDHHPRYRTNVNTNNITTGETQTAGGTERAQSSDNAKRRAIAASKQEGPIRSLALVDSEVEISVDAVSQPGSPLSLRLLVRATADQAWQTAQQWSMDGATAQVRLSSGFTAPSGSLLRAVLMESSGRLRSFYEGRLP